MNAEKKTLKSKIGLGLIILTPFILICWFLSGVIRGFGEIIHWLWINFIPFSFVLPAIVEGILGLSLFILLAFILSSLYYSRKTHLSAILDNLLAKIPFIKEFWQHDKGKSLDLSKLKAVIVIDPFDGIWKLLYIVDKIEVIKNNKKIMTLTKVLEPSYPLFVTGFFRIIDEEKLKKEGKIFYLETSSDFAKIYLSFGFLGPQKLKAD